MKVDYIGTQQQLSRTPFCRSCRTQSSRACTQAIAGICLLLIVLRVAAEPGNLAAAERGLTATDITAAVLAEEGSQYRKDVAEKNFQKPVLGYVTPWNGRGYDIAVRWRGKFTHISPVWYQLKGDASARADGAIQLLGGHDVDQTWIARLREPITQNVDCADLTDSSQTCASDLVATSTSSPLVVPRFISELGPPELTAVLQKPGRAIAAMVDEVQKQGFDGLVFEGWLQWSAMGGFADSHFTRQALEFIKKLAANLTEHNKVLLLAVPPVVPSHPQRPHADTAHLQQLATDVSGFSLMTYDYSTGEAGANGPLWWQEANLREVLGEQEKGDKGTTVLPSQVFMGINFFGYDYIKPQSASKRSRPDEVQAVMGQAFLQALSKHRPKLVWQDKHAEHRIRYKEGGMRHTVYYPTPASLAARIQLAEKLGVGLSIWELGQGMDAFIDLL